MSTLEYSHNTLNKTTFKKKSFSCGICSKDFTRNSSLQTHMNIHLNVKPYVCSICNFRFNANPNLIRHKKNVHNIRFYNGSKESTSKPSSPSQSESERSQTPPPPKKTSISLSDPIYNPDKNMKLTTYVDQQRKLPEPVYNVRIAHPVKFSDLVLYETVINHIESRR